MNTRQVIVEFYVALERANGEGSVDKARKAARSLGLHFTNAESAQWLRPFTAAAGKRRANGGTNGVLTERETAGVSEVVVGLTRDKVIPSGPLFLVEPTGSTQSATPIAKQRKIQQGRLPFEQPIMDRRKAILRAVWQKVEPFIGRATTYTAWSKRNTAVANDLATLRFIPEKVAEAWRRASDEMGEPIRELSLVQRYLERAAADRAERLAQAVHP